MRFCQALNTAKQKLDKFYKSHRKAIEKARPFYKGKGRLDKVSTQLGMPRNSYITITSFGAHLVLVRWKV